MSSVSLFRGGSFSILLSTLSLSVRYTVVAGGFFEGLLPPHFSFFLGGSADIFHQIGKVAIYMFEEACYFCTCELGSETFSKASSHHKLSLTSACMQQEF